MKHNLDFTDFPIPLGAEWVHGEPEILEEIVNDPAVEITTRLGSYEPGVKSAYFEDGVLEMYFDSAFQSDLKFIDSSWLQFFSRYILPGILDRITYNSQVMAIDYSGERIQVTDAAGTIRSADKVVVTAPIKILQRSDIDFIPALPESKTRVIENAKIWSGLKVFLEFDHQFYPTFLSFSDSETRDGQRLYYDAAYGQYTTKNILGLFAVGMQAERYQALSDKDLLQQILRELDEVFDGVATRSYLQHVVQNWNDDPYAGAAYLADVEDLSTSRVLSKSVDERVYFAGEAYTNFDDWGGVHAATRSAADAVNELLS
ncbi:amine oxidase [Chromatiales bacterium (ex Bugula neritina AB1)]|nr:amine oxidase [Chromatiales bacterium (ex Bugula neritina AB1)]